MPYYIERKNADIIDSLQRQFQQIQSELRTTTDLNLAAATIEDTTLFINKIVCSHHANNPQIRKIIHDCKVLPKIIADKIITPTLHSFSKKPWTFFFKELVINEETRHRIKKSDLENLEVMQKNMNVLTAYFNQHKNLFDHHSHYEKFLTSLNHLLQNEIDKKQHYSQQKNEPLLAKKYNSASNMANLISTFKRHKSTNLKFNPLQDESILPEHETSAPSEKQQRKYFFENPITPFNVTAEFGL